MQPRFFDPESKENVTMRYLGGTPHFDIVLYEHIAEKGGIIFKYPADRFIVCLISADEMWVSVHGVERVIAYAEHGGPPHEYCDQPHMPRVYQKNDKDSPWSQSSTIWGASDDCLRESDTFNEELPLMGQIVKLFSGVTS